MGRPLRLTEYIQYKKEVDQAVRSAQESLRPLNSHFIKDIPDVVEMRDTISDFITKMSKRSSELSKVIDEKINSNMASCDHSEVARLVDGARVLYECVKCGHISGSYSSEAKVIKTIER